MSYQIEFISSNIDTIKEGVVLKSGHDDILLKYMHRSLQTYIQAANMLYI